MYATDLFETWNDARLHYTLQFDSSLNDLDVHLRSQGHGQARTFAVILLKSYMKQLKN